MTESTPTLPAAPAPKKNRRPGYRWVTFSKLIVGEIFKVGPHERRKISAVRSEEVISGKRFWQAPWKAVHSRRTVRTRHEDTAAAVTAPEAARVVSTEDRRREEDSGNPSKSPVGGPLGAPGGNELCPSA